MATAAAATVTCEEADFSVGLERLSHLRFSHCFQNWFMGIIIHTWRGFQANVRVFKVEDKHNLPSLLSYGQH